MSGSGSVCCPSTSGIWTHTRHPAPKIARIALSVNSSAIRCGGFIGPSSTMTPLMSHARRPSKHPKSPRAWNWSTVHSRFRGGPDGTRTANGGGGMCASSSPGRYRWYDAGSTPVSLAPALQEAVLDAELVADAADHEVHHVGDAPRAGVERRHRR